MKRTMWVTAALMGSVIALCACNPGEYEEPMPMTTGAMATSPEPLHTRGNPVAAAAARQAPAPRSVAVPTGYKTANWSKSDPNGHGGIGLRVAVPMGWAVTKRGTYWSDYLDPTGQARLRVDATTGFSAGDAVSSAQAADNEVAQLRGTAGFVLIGKRDLPAVGVDALGGTEIVYAFTKDGRTAQATFRFVGKAGTQVVVGVFYPPSRRVVAEQVLGHTEASVAFAG